MDIDTQMMLPGAWLMFIFGLAIGALFTIIAIWWADGRRLDDFRTEVEQIEHETGLVGQKTSQPAHEARLETYTRVR